MLQGDRYWNGNRMCFYSTVLRDRGERSRPGVPTGGDICTFSRRKVVRGYTDISGKRVGYFV